MQRHGWTLLFHDCLIDQLRKLHHAVQGAQRSDPTGFTSNANVKLFHALGRSMLEVIPQDPSRDEYRQGSTLGPRYRHWRRARIGIRFPLFFRYDTRAKAIVYAWVNDRSTSRSSGSRTDPYTVFARMHTRGNPPDDCASLMAASSQDSGGRVDVAPNKSSIARVLGKLETCKEVAATQRALIGASAASRHLRYIKVGKCRGQPRLTGQESAAQARWMRLQASSSRAVEVA